MSTSELKGSGRARRRASNPFGNVGADATTTLNVIEKGLGNPDVGNIREVGEQIVKSKSTPINSQLYSLHDNLQTLNNLAHTLENKLKPILSVRGSGDENDDDHEKYEESPVCESLKDANDKVAFLIGFFTRLSDKIEA